MVASRRREVFSTDVFYFTDPRDQKRYAVIHFVDVFSRFQFAFARPVSSEDGWFSAAVVNNVMRRVRRLYGLPEFLFYDGDGIYTAGDVEKTIAAFGVEPMPSTSDAPWTNGIAEKHGGMLKLVLERFFDDF